jgi:hypothetical protein
VLVTTDQNGGPVEERTEVPRAHADALFDVCAGRTIYDRARIAVGDGREALVDRFTIPGALDLIAVEFQDPDDAASFLTPPWFGPEVTADPSYDPRHVALGGLPAAVDLPLSNETLDALLDTLEDRLGRGRYAPTAAPTPRRPATDTSVIDALRRLASPDQAGQSGAEAVPAAQTDTEAAPVPADEPSARPLTRRNYPPRAGEAETAPVAPAGDGSPGADARIDDVIATLSQALGSTPGAEAEEPGPGMPDVERPVTRLRRLGS